MFGKKTSLAERKEQILESYQVISDKLVYRVVESAKVARELQNEDVPVLQQTGVTVVLLVDGKPITHLAPGQDPYQARKHIDSFFNAKDSEAKKRLDAATAPKTAPKKSAPKASGIRVEKTSI